jgi:hypothetical protein
MHRSATVDAVAPRHRARLLLPVLMLAVAALAAACGSSAPSAEHTTTTAGGNTTNATTVAPQIKTATVTINGHVYPVPREIPQRPIDPYSDSGGQIIISDKGVLPYNLFVDIGVPVVWTNLTAKPVTVKVVGYPVESPPIPPGGTFTHTWTTLYSFSFTTSNGHLGQVNVGAFQS